MDFMEALKTEIEHRRSSIDYSDRKSTNNSIAIDNRSIDKVLDTYPQLVPESYRAWHVNQIKRLGINKYIQLAERATKYGNDPQKLMVSLLRQY